MDGRDLRIFNERTMEVQFFRQENAFLRGDCNRLRVRLFKVDQEFADLKKENLRLTAENQKLACRVAELTASLRESAQGEDALSQRARRS